MAWPIVDWNGVPHYQAQGDFLVPVDPDTGAAIIMLKQDGGIGAGFAAIEQGPPGMHAELQEAINLTPLAHDDPSPASASWTTIAPAGTSTPATYRLNLALHEGEPGEDGDTVLDPADYGGGVPGQILQVNDDADGFELVAQRVTEYFFPATVVNTPSGNVNYTLAGVNIPARPYARRVIAMGGTVVTGEGSDVRVDLLARLDGETGGNIIAQCPGIAQTDRLTLWPGKAAGQADSYDQIAANATGTVHFRTERRAGTTTYTTTNSFTRFMVAVIAL